MASHYDPPIAASAYRWQAKHTADQVLLRGIVGAEPRVRPPTAKMTSALICFTLVIFVASIPSITEQLWYLLPSSPTRSTVTCPLPLRQQRLPSSMATVRPSSFVPSQQSRCSTVFPPTICRRFHRHSPAGSRSTRHFSPSCCIAVSRSDQDASPPSSTVSCIDSSSIRFAFTGGGSGGHIYPAIAIADELRNLCPNAKFLYIGTSEGLESKAVPSAGYDFTAIPASRLSRPILSPQNLLLPYHLLQAIAAAWKILRRFQPHIVIGTGGYVAAPVYIAAALSGTSIGIQEQNAFPGSPIRSPLLSPRKCSSLSERV
ncbi:hypothetical protein KSP39_PZI017209 [Platanthera zijinensis]|uniref:Glycosyltransferase family 28 N-terminal domain-containing protein n=1 Tax=Platanthera zijinensis TaxID=2320716 RepID=A0AAP0B5K0_9ASPA